MEKVKNGVRGVAFVSVLLGQIGLYSAFVLVVIALFGVELPTDLMETTIVTFVMGSLLGMSLLGIIGDV